MSAILEFFATIADIVKGVIDGIGKFLSLVAKIPEFITGMSGFVPNFIFVFVVGVIAILIIKTIVNR